MSNESERKKNLGEISVGRQGMVSLLWVLDEGFHKTNKHLSHTIKYKAVFPLSTTAT